MENTQKERSRWLIFAIVVSSLLMMTIDGTIVATALDAIKSGLGTGVNWAGWTITAYLLGFVLMLPISGKLSERLGRRKVFLGSLIVFTVASVLCGLADNIYLLIILRALQAAGGAGFTPSATGIIVDHFGRDRDRAVGLFGSIFPIGVMIGPIFGGLFVTYWNWRGIFFVNAPIGLLAILMALKFIPKDKPQTIRQREKLDWRGAVLLGTGLLAGMLAASYLGEAGASAWSDWFLLPLTISVLSLIWFFRHIKKVEQPFLAPKLIYGTGFGAVNLLNVATNGTTLAAVALVPIYAINRYGMDALHAATLLIAEGVATIILSGVVSWILRRIGYHRPLYIGIVVAAAGVALLASAPLFGLSAYLWLSCAAFLIGVGGGTISPPSRNAGLQLAPEHASTLAALRSMGNQIGQIVTISIATAFIAATGNSGTAQAWFYVALAIVIVAILPIIKKIPEHRGTW